MELIVAVVVPFLIVVGCAWIRLKPNFNLRPIPLAALSVVITGSVFGSDFFNIPAAIPISLDRVLLVATVGLFAVLWLLGKEDLRKLNHVDVAILGLIAVITFSTLTHNWRFLDNMPASRLLFFNLLPLVIYWLVRTCNLGVAELKFIAGVLGLMGVYLALTAIAEVNGLTGFVFPGYIMTSESQEFLGRGRGPFLNPISNGIFMTTCFCFLLMWWPRIGMRGKAVAITLGLIMVAGIYMTLTRSVWVGFIAACGLFIWLPASRPAKGIMLSIATVGALIAVPMLSQSLFSFKRDKEVTVAQMEKSAELRPLFVIIAWNMFQDRPLTGVGFGQYAKAKYPYLQDPHSGKPLSLTKSLMQHNVFLAYLTETGLIGLSMLVIVLVQMARISWKVWTDISVNLWARQFGLASTVILACYVINGMFHDVSIVPMQHMLMLFVFGIVNNVYSKPSAFEIETQSAERRVPAMPPIFDSRAAAATG